MLNMWIYSVTIIGSDNGLSPDRRQAIIWTIAGILIIQTLGTNISEFLSKIHTFSLKKMHLKMSSGKWRSSCLGLNVLTGGRFKKAYELLNLRALKFSPLNKIHIFQCMGKIFCVEFQRYPLKFHTKYLTHTLKGTIFIQHWNFKSS